MIAGLMQKSDGMNYAPVGKPSPVVQPGEFPFAAVVLDHGHINGQCRGLTEAGGELRDVYDPDPAKVERFRALFPGVQPLRSVDEALEKGEIKLVASAAISNGECDAPGACIPGSRVVFNRPGECGND